MMKHILLIITLILLPLQANASDTKEDRMNAAIAYEKIVPVKDMLNGMLKEMEKNPQITSEDVKAIGEIYDANEMREKMLEAMVNNFTTAEINALTDFYASPEGKSVMKKMPQYMGDFMPYIQQKVQMAIMQRLEQKKAHDHDHGHDH